MRATGLRGGKPADPSVPSSPLRRSPCSSIRKGVSPYGWKNRGEAPRRWLLSQRRLAGLGPRCRTYRLRAGSPTRSLPQGNVPHPGHMRPGSQGPWGRVRGTGSSPCHPEDRTISRGPHLPARLPPPQRQSAREELGTWGPDGVLATVLRQGERVPAGVTHVHGRVLPRRLRPAPRLGC